MNATPPDRGRAPSARKCELDYDVAIVGYGPVGQALAAMLGQAGHRVGVFERWPTLYPLPRACVVDHEAMRILQAAGVAEPFAELTVPTRGEYVWLTAQGETLYHFRYPRDGISGWPSRSLMYQPDLEAQLDRRVKTLQTVEVHQGFEAVACSFEDEGVNVTVERRRVDGEGHLATTDERRNFRARWIVGCDGARSFVREACGLPWRDLGFRADWLVVDVVPNDPSRELDMPEAGQICDPARPMTVMRHMGRRHVRWEMMLLPGETAADICRPERVWPMLARWLSPDEGQLERAAVYTFRSGVARRWREGRCVLAGDAAHLMPPFLGQGLCSGLRDARALFWRLDDILAGRSSGAILASYESERNAHVQAVIDRAVALGRVVCITDPQEAARRDAAILSGQAPPLPPFPTLRDGVLHRPSESRVAGELAPQPVVSIDGRTGRLDDVVGSGWQLLVDGARSDIEWSPEQADFATSIGLRIVILSESAEGRTGITQDCTGVGLAWLRANGLVAALVRPDFYVFGGAVSLSDIPTILADLKQQLRPTVKVIP